MSKELMKQFRNRWQAVAVVEAREQQAASITLRWRQMNAIFRLAFGLKLATTNLDREEEVVATLVSDGVVFLAPHMRERIDKTRAVKDNHGADEEAPDDPLPATNQEKHDGEYDGYQHVKTVEEAEFGVLGQIRHLIEIRWEVGRSRDPPHVRPPEPVVLW